MINIACDVRVNTNIEKVDNLHITGDSKVKVEERAEGMPQCGRNTDFGESLYHFLLERNFIPAETAKESFLYLMGYDSNRPASLHPIQWLKSKQLLREVLQSMYSNMLKGNILTLSAIERGVPTAFVGKDGRQYALASNKPVLSEDSDAIVDFFEQSPK